MSKILIANFKALKFLPTRMLAWLELKGRCQIYYT